jgi:predicted TIM-barrel fold metal-dependent hydrolase
MKYRIISADSHVNEPYNLWQDRLPANLRDQGFKLVDCDDGGQGWTFEGRKPSSYGLGAVAHTQGDFTKYKERGLRFADLPKGNYDPAEHLKDQDRDGIDASVIYPSEAIKLYKINDKALRLASFRAYNDWVAQEFAAHDPSRILPLALIPADDDIGEAVAELQRAAATGHRGAIIPTYLYERDYSDPYFEPLWDAAEATEMPLHFHRVIAKERSSPTGGPNKAAWTAATVLRFFAAMDPISYMMFGGIFHRHPKLKVVSAESNFGWWPFFVQQCDDQWKRSRYWSESILTEEPSAYFRRHVFVTFMDDVVGCANLRFIGADNFMFSTDYPHSVTLWPNSREYIATMMKEGNVSASDQEKLLAGNAARLYKISEN